jgi:benzoyl-CoA reductase/2-hydroxyglutaryl-CoA dehydratase subunit BcrC/BadD/HgdB
MSCLQHPFLTYSETLQNPFVQDWIKDKKKVMGYYCANLPEEMIHAAGFLPFRIRGTGNTEFHLSDALLSRFNCTFVRSTLNLALKGEYDFMDGVLVANTCDHIRRMYDIWKLKVEKCKTKAMKMFFLSLPHTFTAEGLAWMKSEMAKFQDELIKSFNLTLEPSALSKSIEVYNQNSELLTRLNALRALDTPRLTGTEFFKISVANSAVRKEYANEQIGQILQELETNDTYKHENVKARLLLVGSSVDNPNFISILEHAGALIVADTICTGVRSFVNDQMWNASNAAVSSKDPIDNLVQKVYLRTFCPRMMNTHPQRLQFIKEQIKQAKIDGVILQRIEFCDLHGCENALYEHILEEDLNIPVLSLDREYFLGDTGRLRTRVEAFLEQIGRIQ